MSIWYVAPAYGVSGGAGNVPVRCRKLTPSLEAAKTPELSRSAWMSANSLATRRSVVLPMLGIKVFISYLVLVTKRIPEICMRVDWAWRPEGPVKGGLRWWMF